MLFNSIHFAVFFVIVTILYYSINHRVRWFLLLIASCYFYMAFVPVYILILGATIVIDYFAGIYIDKSEGKRRKLYLIISLAANLLVLAVFKYYNFLNENITALLNNIGVQSQIPNLSILLPIGLSFHTFQAMSYTIEVYRKNQSVEKNFGIYALYVMFYPQLVAGPIERPQNMLHQFYEKHTFDYKRVTDGLKLMAWGIFKKVVIADRLAIMVNQVYENPSDYVGIPLIIATVFFSFQIFCDFSAYSDIAVGSAKVMGFKLMKNFDRPYFSENISEFWKRWHISLSTWFKDYLYIPLGGNRVKIPRWYFNLFIVFFVSGLWHGASWNFVIWGGLHGFYLIFALITQKSRVYLAHIFYVDRYPLLNKLLRISTTFSLVTFAWIFFRAKNLSDALYIASHFFRGIGHNVRELVIEGVGWKSQVYLGTNGIFFLITILCVLSMELIHYYGGRIIKEGTIYSKYVWIRWPLYYLMVMAIILLGVFEKGQQFIYFQF